MLRKLPSCLATEGTIFSLVAKGTALLLGSISQNKLSLIWNAFPNLLKFFDDFYHKKCNFLGGH